MMRSRCLYGASIALATLALFSVAAVGQSQVWDPSYGYHEEEWHDPSDWYDADYGIDYETEYFGDYYDDYEEGYGSVLYDDEGYDELVEERFADEQFEELYQDEDFYEDFEGPFEDFDDGLYEGYDEYIGNDYYSSDWYDDEPDFDDWYDYE